MSHHCCYISRHYKIHFLYLKRWLHAFDFNWSTLHLKTLTSSATAYKQQPRYINYPGTVHTWFLACSPLPHCTHNASAHLMMPLLDGWLLPCGAGFLLRAPSLSCFTIWGVYGPPQGPSSCWEGFPWRTAIGLPGWVGVAKHSDEGGHL